MKKATMTLLQKIEEEIQRCTKCVLCEKRTHAVPGQGRHDAALMLIGEAPGKHEDNQGLPFVGMAGNFLDYALSTIGLERKGIYITNIVKCRPPGNRDPAPEEINQCSPYLDAQITHIKPRVICTLGRFAAAYVLPLYGFSAKPISQVHGKVFYAPLAMVNVVPLYHPAASLYTPALKEVFLKDVSFIPSLLDKHKP